MKVRFAMLFSSVLLSANALAWQPTKTVEVLIGHGPGSGNEIVFRALAAEVEKNTGAKFAIINKVGAGGAIATRDLATRKADGHSIGMMTTIGIPVVDKMSIPDPTTRGYTVDDFTYLMLPALNQFTIIANNKDTINTPKDLVNALNKEPTSFIAGGGARLVYEVLKSNTKFNDVVHLNDNGPVHAINEIIGGHSRIAVVPSLVAANFHNQGTIKIIATTGPNRIPQLPKIPTVGEAMPGFVVATGWGIIAPKGLSKEMQDWYTREFERALQSESVKAVYRTNIIELPDAKMRSAEGYRAHVDQLESKYAKIVENYVKEVSQKK